ncbi:hypothetical protein VE04_10098 [Pseudogymnoascus sp. 24MN13]|nr:hypothetical protein VE04_10098 [Pseudogymnoascus sp. 24MN13]
MSSIASFTASNFFSNCYNFSAWAFRIALPAKKSSVNPDNPFAPFEGVQAEALVKEYQAGSAILKAHAEKL